MKDKDVLQIWDLFFLSFLILLLLYGCCCCIFFSIFYDSLMVSDYIRWHQVVVFFLFILYCCYFLCYCYRKVNHHNTEGIFNIHLFFHTIISKLRIGVLIWKDQLHISHRIFFKGVFELMIFDKIP